MKHCINKLFGAVFALLTFSAVDLKADDFVYRWESGRKYIYQLHIVSQMKFDHADSIFSLNELLGYIWCDVDSAGDNGEEWSFRFGSWDAISHNTAKSIPRGNGFFQQEIITEEGFTKGDVKNIGIAGFSDDIPLKPFFSGIWIFRLPERKLSVGESWSYKQEAFKSFNKPLWFNVKWKLLAENDLRRDYTCDRYEIQISVDGTYALNDSVDDPDSAGPTDFSMNLSNFYLKGDMWLMADSNIIVDWTLVNRATSMVSFEKDNQAVKGKKSITETMISFSLDRIVDQDFDMAKLPKLKHDLPDEQNDGYSLSFIKAFVAYGLGVLLIAFISVLILKKLLRKKP